MATIQFAWQEYHLSQPKVQIVAREALVATKSVSLHYKSMAKGVKFSSVPFLIGIDNQQSAMISNYRQT
jgi:hypothetical protein